MKLKPFFLHIAFGISALLVLHAGEPGPVTENASAFLSVGQYGYWSNMPVKIAYFGILSPKQAPPTEFQLQNEQGKTVFSGKPEPMGTPGKVFASVADEQPGERLYALNFSAWKTPGNYRVVVPGFGAGEFFTIRGKMPTDIFPLPSLQQFEKLSHITGSDGKPVLSDRFRKTPLSNPGRESRTGQAPQSRVK